MSILKRILGVVVLTGAAFVAYATYDDFRRGVFSAPERNEGDFLLSFLDNGFRGVMRGIDNEKVDRNYLGYASSSTPSYYEETWSECRKLSEQELTSFEASIDLGPGERVDAICKINADGDVFVRGWITSVPDL